MTEESDQIHPRYSCNEFIIVWCNGEGDMETLMHVHRRGKYDAQGRKIGRRLVDDVGLSTCDCLEFDGPGGRVYAPSPSASAAGGTKRPGLWCIGAVFRQWEDDSGLGNIEQAITLTRGGPAPKWRRLKPDELAAFMLGRVTPEIEAWLCGPTQTVWDRSPVEARPWAPSADAEGES